MLQHAIFFFRIISSVPLIEAKVLVLLLRICGGWVEQALRLNQGRRNRTSLIFIVENYAESSRKNFLFSQTCSQTNTRYLTSISTCEERNRNTSRDAICFQKYRVV